MSTSNGSVGTTSRQRQHLRDAIDQASLSELIGRLGDNVTLLFRQEVELVKAEAKREAILLARAGAMLVAAAVLGLITLMLVAWTVAWALALAMPLWAAFLITAVLFGAIAGGLALSGKKKLAEIDLTPHTTIETLQQDKQMLTDRMSS